MALNTSAKTLQEGSTHELRLPANAPKGDARPGELEPGEVDRSEEPACTEPETSTRQQRRLTNTAKVNTLQARNTHEDNRLPERFDNGLPPTEERGESTGDMGRHEPVTSCRNTANGEATATIHRTDQWQMQKVKSVRNQVKPHLQNQFKSVIRSEIAGTNELERLTARRTPGRLWPDPTSTRSAATSAARHPTQSQTQLEKKPMNARSTRSGTRDTTFQSSSKTASAGTKQQTYETRRELFELTVFER